MGSERFALVLSAWGSLFMAGLGLTFAWLTESNAILLDGFFSLVGFVMALLTLRVFTLVRRRGDEKFHFGYAAFAPMLNTFKALSLLLVCGFALFSAIDSLIDGEAATNARYAVLYGLIAAVGCFSIALAQWRASRTTHSELLPVEIRSWSIDGAMSLAVALAFLGAIWLEGSAWAHLSPYVDPSLVILLVLLVIAVPFRILRDNLGELLAVAPPHPIQDEVRRRFEDAVSDEPFEKSVLRMMRVGRYFYVLIQVVVPAGYPIGNVGELDRIRARIHGALEGVHPQMEIDTLFTSDERWTE